MMGLGPGKRPHLVFDKGDSDNDLGLEDERGRMMPFISNREMRVSLSSSHRLSPLDRDQRVIFFFWQYEGEP